MHSCRRSVVTTRVPVPRPRAEVDALVVTALPAEHRAMALAGTTGRPGQPGVVAWHRTDGPVPYQTGCYRTADGPTVRVALARATRPGCIAAAATASSLAERLRPRCLAMTGICAGNPAVVDLGDVIVADSTYVYDEGHRTVEGFVASHRQIPMSDAWVRAAQDLPVVRERIVVGPMVSGTMVVRDGGIWQQLAARGGRHVVGLDMEAAAVASSAYHLGIPAWAVVKGVSDHADPRKDDRCVTEAAHAAATVLWRLLLRQLVT